MNSHNSVLHILGEKIAAGESREINFHVAKLHTQTSVEVAKNDKDALEPMEDMNFF